MRGGDNIKSKTERIRELKQARARYLNEYKTGLVRADIAVRNIDAVDIEILRMELEDDE